MALDIVAAALTFLAVALASWTPEFLGKKIEQPEIRLAMLANLVVPFVVLGFGAAAVVIPAGLSSISNPGAHGLSQVLYAFKRRVPAGAGTLQTDTTLFIVLLVGVILIAGTLYG
jgi:K+-transporting ATPase A subunit